MNNRICKVKNSCCFKKNLRVVQGHQYNSKSKKNLNYFMKMRSIIINSIRNHCQDILRPSNLMPRAIRLNTKSNKNRKGLKKITKT